MAHERLRFPIILNDIEVLENANEAIYQPIFSDTAYGTHFGLFANFKGSLIDKGKYCLDQLEIKIQNYTGDISLGITKILGHRIKELPEAFSLKDFSTGRLIKFYVLLQAFNNSSIGNYPEKKEAEPELVPLELELVHGDVIEIVTLYEPVDNALSRINENPDTRNKECLYADPQFLYRDGEEIGFLKGAKDKMDIIDVAKKEGLDSALLLASSKDLNTIFVESFDKLDTEDIIFSAIGGGRACKMKLSDIYIFKE